MNQNIEKKLRQQRGESIAETLIGLLISSLALLMLAGAITTATRIITQSKNVMRNYYEKNNDMIEEKNSGSSGTLVLSEKNASGTEGDISKSFSVKYYKNEMLGNYPVISYSLDMSGGE